MRQLSWKTYAFWILLSEAVGALSGWLTREGAARYAAAVQHPPLSPPGPVFPLVWTVLFALMGAGAARVYAAPSSAARRRSLVLFLLQLLAVFVWPILFFQYQRFGLAVVWLCALWALVWGLFFSFRRVDRPAAWLQLPYLLWVAFALYLNLGVWVLNR